MRFDLLTLHPDMCRGPLDHSMLGRARAAGLFEIAIHDIRDQGTGKHRVVDDTPYGGGSGMLLRVDVVDRAIEAVRGPTAHVILLDPAGKPFRQADAVRLASLPQIVLVCGHYEGVDGRVRQHLVDEAFSVGDFVLTGGEIPALAIIDAVARLLPGVLGNPDSSVHESFGQGLLEAPQFTRPASYRGWDVPEILQSGHHGKVAAWRAEQSRALTQAVRPDLLGDPDLLGEE
jgi:tRNA (guanine37-N1)-methyltransferase